MNASECGWYSTTTYILVRVFLASIFLIVFEVFAFDFFVVFGFGFGFFVVVDFFGWLGLGLALFGFGSWARGR